MERLEKVAKFTEEYLKPYCKKLEVKKELNKYLFFCGNYLLGSTVQIDENRVATTVYSAMAGDKILREFLKAVKEKFNGKVKEQGINMSHALDEEFYYAYNHIEV